MGFIADGSFIAFRAKRYFYMATCFVDFGLEIY
jgi:hypothetical protein